ncbi:MAG: hypothetical protein HEQ40_16480 [Lacibacter sp.]
MIYLKPEYGLANRIRVIVSGINLAEALGTSITIIWDSNAECNINFKEIFNEKKIACKVKKFNIFYKLAFYSGSNPAVKYLQGFILKFLKVDFLFTDAHMKEFVWRYGGDIINIKSLKTKFKNNLAIKSCHEFYFNRDVLINRLVPTEELQRRINNFFRDDCEIIGVHIRRTDNEVSIKKSPLSAFVKRIELELKKNPDVKFYLATDSVEVIEDLLHRFGSKIIYEQKLLSRNSPQGIKDAFFDIGVLSKCNKILGSYWSSFSYIASQYGNIPLEIIVEE